MIKIFYKDTIINILATILSFGFNSHCSFTYIEEHLISSSFVNNLESAEFDIDTKVSDLIKEIYKVEADDNYPISSRALFIAESYIKLFFKINKSFEYIFLYLPISLMVEKYEQYHTVDFIYVYDDFIQSTKETPLLKKICKKRGIKLVQLSSLTGISINTIKSYSTNDEKLYSAGYDYLYLFSLVLKVKSNFFLSYLAVYEDSSAYRFDKTNVIYRSYLCFYLASYYDSRISDNNYTYNQKDNIFLSTNNSFNIRSVVLEDYDVTINTINKTVKKNEYLIIMISGYYYHSIEDYMFLKDSNAKEVMVITQENVFIIKRNIAREITDTVNRLFIIRAKLIADKYLKRD